MYFKWIPPVRADFFICFREVESQQIEPLFEKIGGLVLDIKNKKLYSKMHVVVHKSET